MNLPPKVYETMLSELIKEARFSWYSGWEKSSGYIKSELRGDSAFGTCRVYVKWEKKREPTAEQMKTALTTYLDEMLENRQHHCDQRDFTHYLLNTFYVDTKRLEKQVTMSVENSLSDLISILEASERFTEPHIQMLHNDLKNLDAGLNDHGAIRAFLENGRKRIGES